MRFLVIAFGVLGIGIQCTSGSSKSNAAAEQHSSAPQQQAPTAPHSRDLGERNQGMQDHDSRKDNSAKPVDKANASLVQIPNAALYEGMLVGGQPAESDYAKMAKSGYKTVIDLRGEGEEESHPNQALTEAAGMRYLRIPIANGSDFSRAKAEALAEGIKDGPVVVHCKSGNRVGALFAIKEHLLDGRPLEEALAKGESAGMTKLSDTIRALLESKSL